MKNWQSRMLVPDALGRAKLLLSRNWSPSLGFVFILSFMASIRAAEPVSPLTPAQAIQAMRLDPALSIELVASEPMVQDPVAVCWDAHGAMYVAEMGDYPAQPTGGRIKRLVDTDGDGRMDKVTTFLAEIAYPTSVLPYRDGILVTAAPDIIWIKDTDGDGIADQRQVLLTGFREGNQQLRVNGLVRGLDGWIYGANGRSDGDIGFTGEDGKLAGTPVSIRSTDFRFQPDDRIVETAGGFTQYGQSFDDFGQRFISWNTVHIRHVVMEQRYLARNPNAPVTATAQELSDAGSTPRVFPISETTKRFNAETPGFFNASCGLTIFRGDGLGDQYRGQAFACEPLSNLVHRDVLHSEGASFIASRAAEEQEREFLASTDTWFRPVNLATSPDGDLYVVDFYRRWVEHPQWVANEEARKTVDWSEGKEFGRIYRIVPKARSEEKTAHPSNLAALDSKDLVPLLTHPNAWQRETAQRLLVERHATGLDAELIKLANSAPIPQGRIHALATLRELKGLTSQCLLAGLRDSSPEVRRFAVQLAEPQLDRQSPENHAIVDAVEALADDEHAQVRFQVACSLSYLDASEKAAVPLAKLFAQDGNDPWMLQALFVSARGQAPALVRELAVNQSLAVAKLSIDQSQWLVQVIGSESSGNATEWHELRETFAAAGQKSWLRLLALGLATAQSAEPWFAEAVASANSIALDLAAPMNDRLVAIGLLKYLAPAEAIPSLEQLLTAEQAPEIQQWAAESVSEIPGNEAAQVQIHAIAQTSPTVRRALLDSLIGRRDRAQLLAQAILSGEFAANELDGSQRELLLSRLDESSRESLSKKFVPAGSASRNEVIAKYAPALAENPDVARGRQLFQQHCRTCHFRQGDGHRVGPDLTGVAGRSPTDILADVLDPNRSVSVDGRSFTLVTKSGVVHSGLIAGESATSVTLKKPGGLLESVLRTEIEELRFTGKSLMPEGFEQLLSPGDLANLIAFLKDANIR
jgi:putative membrane-bound dehydrogenase-like protein